MNEATRLGGNTGDTYSHELVGDEHRTYEKSPSVALIFQVVALLFFGPIVSADFSTYSGLSSSSEFRAPT
jgi:hypothetical protein